MAYRKNNKKHSGGFTLIEVIAVMVIIGVVAAVVVSRMMSPSSFGVVSEADILKGHLRYAQYRAMSHSENWGISFLHDEKGYYYSLVYPPTTTASNLPYEDSSTHKLPSGINISSDAGSVYFNEWGNPVDASGKLLVAATDDETKIVKEIVLSGGSTERTVKIKQNTGFIE